MSFTQLHQQKYPLLIANVWDVSSARVANKLGFSAMGTSSAAIASTLGYEDGQEMSFDELTFIVDRIIDSVQLPLSVDIEYGYGANPTEIVQNIMTLADMGVVGINLEDSHIDGVRNIDGVRKLRHSEAFSQELIQITEELKTKAIDVFINVRTDSFLLDVEDKLTLTIDRINEYERAGVDGVFVPGVVNEKDIFEIVDSTNLPVNVMCVPGLPDFSRLQQIGVKRISMGNFLFESMINALEKAMNEVQQNQSFKKLFQNED